MLAGIWLLQLSDADTGAETYNELRRKLNLPEVGDLDSAGLDLNRVPLGRLSRLKPDSLTDEQLKQAFNRAVVANFVLALRRLAPEVVKRPNMPVAEYKLSAYRLLVRYATNSDEALRLIDESRKLAEANKQSSAPWDLMELSFRIQRGEAPAVMQLIDHLQRQHGREPGVAQALVQLLVQTGLVGPDGRLNIGTRARCRHGRHRQTLDTRRSASRGRKEIVALVAGLAHLAATISQFQFSHSPARFFASHQRHEAAAGKIVWQPVRRSPCESLATLGLRWDPAE